MNSRDSFPPHPPASLPRPMPPAAPLARPLAPGPISHPAAMDAGPGGPQALSFRTILRGLGRYWWQLLVAWMVLSGAVTALIYTRVKPSFESHALLLAEQGVQDLFGIQVNARDPNNFLETQVNLIRSTGVLAAAAHDERISTLPRFSTVDDVTIELNKLLNIFVIPGTSLIRVSVNSESPDEAYRIVNAVCDAFIENAKSAAYRDNKLHIEKLELASQKIKADAEQKKREWKALAIKTANAMLPIPAAAASDSPKSETKSTNRDIPLEEYKQVREALRRYTLELYEAEAELALREVKPPDASEGDPAGRQEQQIRDALKFDPGLRALEAEVKKIDSRIRDIVRRSRAEENDPAVVHLKARRDELIDQGRDEYAAKEEELRFKMANVAKDNGPELRLLEARDRVERIQKTKARLENELRQVEIDSRQEAGDTVEMHLVQRSLGELQEMESSLNKRLEQLKFESKNESRVNLYDRAVPPMAPTSDKRKKLMLVAPLGILGVLMAVVVLLEIRSGRIGHPDELTSCVRAEVFSVPPLPTRRAVGNSRLQNERIEEFIQRVDHVRVALCGEPLDGVGRCVLITSAAGGEGKTTLATQLAGRCANAGLSTVLIDADLRRPSLAQLLDVPSTPGLSDVLRGEAQVDETLVEIGDGGGFHLLPAGSPLADPNRVLRGGQLGRLIGQLRQAFDIIIIDTPPVLPVPDVLTMGAWVDGAILTVRHDASRIPLVGRANRTLSGAGIPILGVVINGVRTSTMGYGGYASAYGGNFHDRSSPMSDEPTA